MIPRPDMGMLTKSTHLTETIPKEMQNSFSHFEKQASSPPMFFHTLALLNLCDYLLVFVITCTTINGLSQNNSLSEDPL